MIQNDQNQTACSLTDSADDCCPDAAEGLRAIEMIRAALETVHAAVFASGDKRLAFAIGVFIDDTLADAEFEAFAELARTEDEEDDSEAPPTAH